MEITCALRSVSPAWRSSRVARCPAASTIAVTASASSRPAWASQASARAVSIHGFPSRTDAPPPPPGPQAPPQQQVATGIGGGLSSALLDVELLAGHAALLDCV
jgi:hypothetical protein